MLILNTPLKPKNIAIGIILLLIYIPGNATHISILDGGTGREVSKRGLPFKQPEWSAEILLSNNKNHLEALRDIHFSFIESGADIITTNSYAIAPFHIGIDRFLHLGQKLINKSIDIAYEAKIKSNKVGIKIAGSIPPLFGSYRPDLFKKSEALELYPLVINEFIKNKKVDCLLAETISSIEEADTIMFLITSSKLKKDYWLSFTLDENTGHLRSGERVEDIASLVAQYQQKPKAILFNCSQPEIMQGAIQKLANLNLDVRIGAYANLFEEKQNANPRANAVISNIRTLSINQYMEYARSWIKAGATIVGGCCGVGPEYIKSLSNLKNIRHQ